MSFFCNTLFCKNCLYSFAGDILSEICLRSSGHDVFSLGKVLWELLENSLPAVNESIWRTFAEVCLLCWRDFGIVSGNVCSCVLQIIRLNLLKMCGMLQHAARCYTVLQGNVFQYSFLFGSSVNVVIRRCFLCAGRFVYSRTGECISQWCILVRRACRRWRRLWGKCPGLSFANVLWYCMCVTEPKWRKPKEKEFAVYPS